jgi:hypothetical protein
MLTADLTNRRFTRLVVFTRAANTKQGSAMWVCQCDCGAVKAVSSAKLRSGSTRSCGCLKAEAESPQDRIRNRVDIDESTGCWNWRLRVDRNGYGRIMDTTTRTFESAHRYAYRAFHRAIPEGMFVLHMCDNKRCCNPAHLFPGTHQDNMDDMWLKRRDKP